MKGDNVFEIEVKDDLVGNEVVDVFRVTSGSQVIGNFGTREEAEAFIKSGNALSVTEKWAAGGLSVK